MIKKYYMKYLLFYIFNILRLFTLPIFIIKNSSSQVPALSRQ